VPEEEKACTLRNTNSVRRRTMVTYKGKQAGKGKFGQKQYDMTTLGGIKGWKGPMGCHINRANWRWQGRVMESMKPSEVH
jgi:hypothetical protein